MSGAKLHPVAASPALRRDGSGNNHDLMGSAMRVVVHAIDAGARGHHSGLEPTWVFAKQRHDIDLLGGLVAAIG